MFIAFSLGNPISRPFPCQKEKKTLPRARADVSELVCVATNPIQLQEFQPDSLSSWAIELLIRDLTKDLGPSNPWPITVLREPFSTSAANVSNWLFATTTKICTRCRSTQAHAKGFWQHPRPPTHWCILLYQWSSIGHTLERHPFSGLIHSAGESWHTPWRVTTFMSTALLFRWINTFCGIWWAYSLAP
jgi:hypothetical protein